MNVSDPMININMRCIEIWQAKNKKGVMRID